MSEKRVVLFDIGILATATRLRGIGRYVSELGRGLAALKQEWGDIQLVFLEGLSFDGTVTLSPELEPAIERLTQGPVRSRYSWAYPLRLFAGLAASRAGASLLHLPAPGATPLALGGVPHVVTCHDLIPYKFPQHYAGIDEGFRWGRRALDRRRYGSARHVIAISQATATDLEQLLGLRADAVSTVLSGIDATRWVAPRDADDAEQLRRLNLTGKRFVAYVGDIDWRKNMEGMISALAEARKSDDSLELVWVGKPSSPSREQACRAHAAACGVTNACQFLGYVPDAGLQAVYRAALATLLVSRAEGFGYPVLEAMASGCPVIASSVSSLPEVAENAALLVDPESPRDIADAILQLAQGPARRSDLIERGRRRAAELNLVAQARGTLDVYRRLLRAI
ncbi:MAG TPA: glycosyltransferase family 1 protein [Polyangiaceae bacterium]|nr:glycosyltransferase family 1 protein [Polyangiaceae bacterium]